MSKNNPAIDALKYHVTGAIERGEKEPIYVGKPIYSLQFLALTSAGVDTWVTHLEADTEDQAWHWLDRLSRFEYPAKKWRWTHTIENTTI